MVICASNFYSTPTADAGFVLNITPRLGFNRSNFRFSQNVLQEAEQRWHAWFAAVPRVDERYMPPVLLRVVDFANGFVEPTFFFSPANPYRLR